MDILPELRARQLADDEIIAAIDSVERYNTQQTAARTWEFRADNKTVGKYETNAAGKLKLVDLPTESRMAVLKAVDEDNGSPMYTTAAVTLFSHRPVRGFARVQDWIQIRPLLDESQNQAFPASLFGHIPGVPPIPFALEIRCRGSAMWLLHSLRLDRQIRQANSLVTAFLECAVFQQRSPYAYVSIDGKTVLARCAAPQAPEPADGQVFSDVTGLRELEVIPRDQYFSELGITARELRVPDLQSLWSAFNALDAEHQARFLRACASLTSATNPDIDRGLFVLSLVTSIEALCDASSETCPTCGSKLGVGKNFQNFLSTHVQESGELLKAYKDLYGRRSNLVHGSLHYDTDEPAMGIRETSFATRLAAWSAAKRGIVNWLLAQS